MRIRIGSPFQAPSQSAGTGATPQYGVQEWELPCIKKTLPHLVPSCHEGKPSVCYVLPEAVKILAENETNLQESPDDRMRALRRYHRRCEELVSQLLGRLSDRFRRSILRRFPRAHRTQVHIHIVKAVRIEPTRRHCRPHSACAHEGVASGRVQILPALGQFADIDML